MDAGFLAATGGGEHATKPITADGLLVTGAEPLGAADAAVKRRDRTALVAQQVIVAPREPPRGGLDK